MGVRHAGAPRAAPASPLTSAALSPLLSAVFLAFTVDFESGSRISLAISANTLRVLTTSGVRVRDLPRLSGVSREANAMCALWLERRGCVVTEPVADATRGKKLRLTLKGQKARQKYHRLVDATEESWREKFGLAAVGEVREALERVVGDGTLAASPLAAGLTPYPRCWRAGRRHPDTLPHQPMVLHRGGYPDGS